jgi:hypothetical protein
MWNLIFVETMPCTSLMYPPVSAGRKQNLRSRLGVSFERKVSRRIARGDDAAPDGRIFPPRKSPRKSWRSRAAPEVCGSRVVGARGVVAGDAENRWARGHPRETHFERNLLDTGSKIFPE